MGALQNVIVGGQHQSPGEGAFRLGLVQGEKPEKHVRIGNLEIIDGVLHFSLVMYITVGDLPHPFEVEDVVYLLYVHGYTF